MSKIPESKLKEETELQISNVYVLYSQAKEKAFWTINNCN